MMSMSVEPEFKRCCFCFPLRHGLLVWGYFKVIADVLILLLLGYFTLLLLAACFFFGCIFILNVYAITSGFLMFLILGNLAASIVFIIGGHAKNLKQIKGFYKYSIVEFIVMTVLILVAVGISLASWPRSHDRESHVELFISYFVTLALHGYFILLLESEVVKLSSFGEISFVKNAAEGQRMVEGNGYEKQAAIEHV